jgi:hypothetical protein
MNIKDCELDCGGACRARVLIFRSQVADTEPDALTDVIVTTCQEAGDDLQEVEDRLLYENTVTAELWAVEPDGTLAWAATDPELRFWAGVEDYLRHGNVTSPEGETIRAMDAAFENDRIQETQINPWNLRT